MKQIKVNPLLREAKLHMQTVVTFSFPSMCGEKEQTKLFSVLSNVYLTRYRVSTIVDNMRTSSSECTCRQFPFAPTGKVPAPH